MIGFVDILVVLGCISSLIPVLALLLRKLPVATRISAGIFSGSILAFVLFVWKLSHLGPREPALPWIYGLILAGIVAVLAGYLISAIVGREDEGQPQYLRPSFLGLAAIGLLSLAYLKHPQFVGGYEWVRGGGVITFGFVGKVYLSYLLVLLVLIGSNLESTYRVASRPVRKSLLGYFVTLFGLLGFATYVLASGLLYSFMPMSKLVALIVPLSAGSIAIGHGFLRGKLLDSKVPVSRAVVYSSITAVAAGLYLLSIGLVAQIAGVFKWSPNAIVSISLVFFAVFLTGLLAISRRIQRRLRRFVDRNFYVKRHDYQNQWNQVSEALNPGQGEDGLIESVIELYQQAFYAGDITLALRDRGSNLIRPVRGKGVGDPDLTLSLADPLCRTFLETRHSLLLDGNVEDFEYLPIYVEEEAWLSATASQAITPLLVGDEILGVVGLERLDEHEGFNFEDLDLMDKMSFQVATVFKGLHLNRELTEARETELLGQWSSMILHDLKNQLLPLQALARNMKEYMDNPDFLREAVNDLSALARGTEGLVQRISRFRDDPHPRRDPFDLNETVERILEDLPAARSPEIRLELDLEPVGVVHGDPAQIESVVRNLVVNALDAMQGKGSLAIKTSRRFSREKGHEVVLSVVDSGPGMDSDFVRTRLFAPFATTKKHGLGLGLYQCRNIVRGHGGEISVKTKPGSGARFDMTLKVDMAMEAANAALEAVT